MARRSRAAADPANQVERIKNFLDNFAENLLQDDLRERVKKLVPAFHALRDLGSGLVPEEFAGSARERILSYLRNYPKQLVDGDELLVVSGIGEWARRVRELRVEYGWWIYTGVTIREMVADDPSQAAAIQAELGKDPNAIKPDQYVLMRLDEDREAAHRWNVLNTIRKKKAAVKTKIIEYLRANVGRSVTIEELRYLAGNRNEWARRVRELRTQDGWPVFTRMQGRLDLPVGTYVLDEDKQAEVHDRQIPDDVRVSVLTRDVFACTHCGWTRDQLSREDPRKYLELHHRVAHADKGANTVENLVTLCNVHHDQVHARTLGLA